MSSKRSNRSSQSQPRAIDQTDIETLVPDRLADLDYSIFDQLTVFENRGHQCNVESLISYLGAAISNAAVEDGEDRDSVIGRDVGLTRSVQSRRSS